MHLCAFYEDCTSKLFYININITSLLACTDALCFPLGVFGLDAHMLDQHQLTCRLCCNLCLLYEQLMLMLQACGPL